MNWGTITHLCDIWNILLWQMMWLIFLFLKRYYKFDFQCLNPQQQTSLLERAAPRLHTAPFIYSVWSFIASSCHTKHMYAASNSFIAVCQVLMKTQRMFQPSTPTTTLLFSWQPLCKSSFVYRSSHSSRRDRDSDFTVMTNSSSNSLLCRQWSCTCAMITLHCVVWSYRSLKGELSNLWPISTFWSVNQLLQLLCYGL